MIPNDATRRQIEAADPKRSTWLSANAGSGKTRVLTDRVARLLLGGTRPENILCLTYTKAAASEMQNRLFKRLGEWAMMPSGDLRKALIELSDDAGVTQDDVRNARTLFAAAIETPGGLKIQTIHSFCSGILRRFPLEAKVSPQFKEIEDRAAQLLREEVLDEMALGDDADAVAGFATYYTGAKVPEFLTRITSQKSAFLSTVAEDAIDKALGLPAGASQDSIIASIATLDDMDTIKHLVPLLLASGPMDKKAGQTLRKIDTSTGPDLYDVETLEGPLLFGATATRRFGAKIDSFPTKAIRTNNPELIEDLNDLMVRVEEGRNLRLAWAARERAHALIAFATPFVQRYEAKKAQRGFLDFDDLIGKAKALLEDPIVAQWVLFRLDGGVDHVLVDEAQDTSPDQWDIVRLLTQEFSTGLGANPERERTVFVVGDKKQSIYSFQGADPEGFDRMRDYFDDELGNVRKVLQKTELVHSFRSSEAVLRLVDQTFSGDMADGVGVGVSHLAFKDTMPGRVDIWPAIEPSEQQEDRKWDDPVDIVSPTNNKVVLAGKIAAEIKRIIEHETLPVEQDKQWKRRKITPGDFLILVQRRSDLFNEIIAACKKAELDVAGADRLKLGGELAVKDISALLRFLALQDDDLSLAAALKSPLFGWSEKQLYDLAQPRPERQTLWEALRTSGQHAETLEVLHDLRKESDFLRPYDLINRLLIRHHGRHKLLARLGHEAEDGIDALLSQALGFEQSAVPSLTGFLSWLQTEDVTVKRQMDSAGDRIRVMTVHGAKGLEAPIVILPDTAKRNRRGADEILVHDGVPLWKPNSPQMPQSMVDMDEDVAAANDRERRRLLYVAMTRAESWLIIAAAGEVGDGQDSWHSTVSGAIDHLDSVDHDTGTDIIKRFARHDWGAGPLVSTANIDAQPDPKPAFGDSILDPVPAQKLYAPSDLGGDKVLKGESDAHDSEVSLARGRIIHTLLELLPPLNADSRNKIGANIIANHPDCGWVTDQGALLAEALAVISHPDLRGYFETGLAEVAVSAALPSLGGNRMYGIIDRLVVTEADVLAIDFKSNRVTPKAGQDAPNGLIRQMAAYRDALRQIYPDHRIRTAILWTKTCTLSEIPDRSLDDALADVTVS